MGDFKNSQKKTVRFNAEPQVVFVEQDEPDHVPGLADWSLCTIHQRGRADRYGILRRPRPFQQRRPSAPQPAKQQDVLALIKELFEKPLEQSPPSSPSAVTMSSSSAVTMSSPSAVTLSSSPSPLLQSSRRYPSRNLLPKSKVLPEPHPRPRSNKLVTCRGTHRIKHLTIGNGPSGSAKLAAKSRFLKPLCVNPPCHWCQSDKAGEGSVRKHKGRCKKCDRVANQPQGENNEEDNDCGCRMG